MSSVKVKIRQPFHRVKILKGKDAMIEDINVFLPIDTIPDDDIIEKLDEFDENEIEKEKKEDPKPSVFTGEFCFCIPKNPISISLEKIPPKSIPVDDVKKEVQKAYDNGFDDGQKITTSNFKAEIEKYRDWMRRIDSVIEDLAISYHYEVNKFDDSLTSLARMMAEHILVREISQDSAVVLTQAKKAIDSLDEDQIFRIRINPDDLEALEDSKSTLSSDSSISENIVLSPDDSIEKGGCILETSAGTVDARISKQLEKLENALNNVALNNEINENDS